jgi:hypothetical protein
MVRLPGVGYPFYLCVAPLGYLGGEEAVPEFLRLLSLFRFADPSEREKWASTGSGGGSEGRGEEVDPLFCVSPDSRI